MTRKKIDGPVYDLDKVKSLIREGRVVMAGTPPDMRAGAKHDFTVTNVEMYEGFTLQWQTVSAGFGQLTFYNKNGKLHCDTEAMSRDFVRSVLMKLADDVILDD